eukprot:c15305_g1_i1.p1 GENE.c15305_g1_i1~~c15305_g1_i1.p1  ORF type:complete len:316 (-),score=41.38 c15305_g1_i1:3-950(-)
MARSSWRQSNVTIPSFMRQLLTSLARTYYRPSPVSAQDVARRPHFSRRLQRDGHCDVKSISRCGKYILGKRQVPHNYVFFGTCIADQSEVVIKVIRRTNELSTHRELAKTICHIPRLIEVKRFDSNYSLAVFEKLGDDLEILNDRDGPLSVNTVAEILLQVLRLIKQVHDAGYVCGPGTVKVDNFVLGHDKKTVYLIDMENYHQSDETFNKVQDLQAMGRMFTHLTEAYVDDATKLRKRRIDKFVSELDYQGIESVLQEFVSVSETFSDLFEAWDDKNTETLEDLTVDKQEASEKVDEYHPGHVESFLDAHNEFP